MEALLAGVAERAERSSRNSSMPPSSDDPKSRAERRAADRAARKRSSRKKGAQPGHEPNTRKAFEPERVDETISLELPAGRCLCGGELDAIDPLVHQVAELPPQAVIVTEYQLARAVCRCCKRTARAPLPRGVSDSSFGPQLSALICSLRFEHRVSVRNIRELIADVMGCPISTGAIVGVCHRVADAVDEPYQAMIDALQASQTCSADETSWACAGVKKWLWMGQTGSVVVMMIRADRSQASATALLGAYEGVVLCDRYSGYNHLPHRAACWEHLKRDFIKVSERTGRVAKRVGAELADHARLICKRYRDYKTHGSIQQLAADIDPIEAHVCELLVELASRGDEKSARLADDLLLKYWHSLWRFIDTDGIEPTNNVSERLLRHPVILRHITGGSESDRGERTTERLLSIYATCKRQGRSFRTYLADALTATTRGDPIPLLT